MNISIVKINRENLEIEWNIDGETLVESFNTIDELEDKVINFAPEEDLLNDNNLNKNPLIPKKRKSRKTKTQPTGKWTKESILNIITTNDDQLIKALLKLYNYQTQYEQSFGETVDHNNVGFNGCDAKFLSSLVEFYKKHNYLSFKQKIYLRKKIKKYASQLARIANDSTATVTV